MSEKTLDEIAGMKENIDMTTVVFSLLPAWNEAYTAAACGAALAGAVVVALALIWLTERRKGDDA